MAIFSVSKIIFCNGVVFLLIKIRLLFLWEIAKIMPFVHRFSIRPCSLQKKLCSLTIFAWGYCCCFLRRFWRHLVIKAIATSSSSDLCSRETVTKLYRYYQKFRNHGCVVGWVFITLWIISRKRYAISRLGLFQMLIILNLKYRPRWLLRIDGKARTRKKRSRWGVRCQKLYFVIMIVLVFCKCTDEILILHNLNNFKCWRQKFCNYRTAGIWMMTKKRKMRRKANLPPLLLNPRRKFTIKSPKER